MTFIALFLTLMIFAPLKLPFSLRVWMTSSTVRVRPAWAQVSLRSEGSDTRIGSCRDFHVFAQAHNQHYTLPTRTTLQDQRSRTNRDGRLLDEHVNGTHSLLAERPEEVHLSVAKMLFLSCLREKNYEMISNKYWLAQSGRRNGHHSLGSDDVSVQVLRNERNDGLKRCTSLKLLSGQLLVKLEQVTHTYDITSDRVPHLYHFRLLCVCLIEGSEGSRQVTTQGIIAAHAIVQCQLVIGRCNITIDSGSLSDVWLALCSDNYLPLIFVVFPTPRFQIIVVFAKDRKVSNWRKSTADALTLTIPIDWTDAIRVRIV